MLHTLAGETGAVAPDVAGGRYAVCGGHGGAYAAGWVVERSVRLAEIANTEKGVRESLRMAGYDTQTGTLYLDTGAEEDEAEADLTDDEMVIVRNASGRVVSVTVPFIDTYWRDHWRELVDALSAFGQVNERALEFAISRDADRDVATQSYRGGASYATGRYIAVRATKEDGGYVMATMAGIET